MKIMLSPFFGQACIVEIEQIKSLYVWYSSTVEYLLEQFYMSRTGIDRNKNKQQCQTTAFRISERFYKKLKYMHRDGGRWYILRSAQKQVNVAS